MNLNNKDGRLKRDSHTVNVWKIQISRRTLVQSALSLLEFVTALFINARTLKFKNQLTFAFFAAVNHLNGPLRKQNVA